MRKLHEKGGANAKKVAKRAEKMREICQSEAFFGIDRNLHMTESNVTAGWISSSIPDKRGSTFTRAEEEEGKVLLPDRSAAAAVQRKSRIEDKYQRK